MKIVSILTLSGQNLTKHLRKDGGLLFDVGTNIFTGIITAFLEHFI